jgi:hypothetical protein
LAGGVKCSRAAMLSRLATLPQGPLPATAV